jgi:putative modified peptide
MIDMATDPRLSAEDAGVLLDNLINDAAFRERFAESPAQALSSIGLDAALGEKDCMKIDSLASVEELSRVRDGLQKHLASSLTAMNVVFCFEAGKVDERIGG